MILSRWPWGESKNAGPQLHAIKVEGVRRAESQGQCVCGKPMGLSPVSPKNAPFCSMPCSCDLQFNRRLTGCGVQRTRTLCFGDLSIGICLDCDALFGSDIDMGSLGIFGISLKAWALYAKGAEEKGAEDGGAVFKERMSNWVLESRSYSAPDVSSVAWRRNSNA